MEKRKNMKENVEVLEYCTEKECDYEHTHYIEHTPIVREWLEECPQCQGWIEQDFYPHQMTITTFTLSPQEPRQTDAGASGMAWQAGTQATTFWDFADNSYGYCFHGVSIQEGLAFEDDDILGFKSLAESEAAAREQYAESIKEVE